MFRIMQALCDEETAKHIDGIEFHRSSSLADRILLISPLPKDMRVHCVYDPGIGIQAKRRLELAFRSRPIPVVIRQSSGQRGMGFRELIIQLKSVLRCLFGSRQYIRGREAAVEG